LQGEKNDLFLRVKTTKRNMNNTAVLLQYLKQACPQAPTQTTTLVSSALNLLITLLLGFIIVGLKSTNVLNCLRRKKQDKIEVVRAVEVMKEAAATNYEVLVQTNVEILNQVRQLSFTQNSNTPESESLDPTEQINGSCGCSVPSVV